MRAVNRGGGPRRVGADLPGAGTGNGLWRGEAGEAGQQDVVDQRAQCGGGDGPLVDQGAEQDVGGQHIPQVVADGLLDDLPPGSPSSGSADAGIPPLGQDTTSIMATAVRSRWPRIPRAAPRGGLVAGFRVARPLGRMLPRGSPVRFRAGSASSQEHCRSARSGAVGVREQKPTTPATRQGRSRTAAEYTASSSTADDCFKLPPIADLPSGPSDLTARSPHRGKRRCSGQGRPRP